MSRAHRGGTRTTRPCWREAWTRLALGAGATLLSFAVTSCTGAVHSGSSPRAPHFPDSARGDARFAQWILANSGRQVRLVDVTAAYPDPKQAVAGAIVLVDKSRVPYPANDYTHRPVVVRYTSRQAAQAATRGHDLRTYSRRGLTVLWIPSRLPSRVAAEYRLAGSAGLQ